jgi:hypothetical protein
MSEWISVDDRLPKLEIYQPILIARDEKSRVPCVMAGHYRHDTGEFISSYLGVNRVFVEPTHWMPLPEPPK